MYGNAAECYPIFGRVGSFCFVISPYRLQMAIANISLPVSVLENVSERRVSFRIKYSLEEQVLK